MGVDKLCGASLSGNPARYVKEPNDKLQDTLTLLVLRTLGRKAKVYSITARGRKQLVDEHESWERLTRGVTRVLRYS